jgi:ribosomal protein S18 acetylase RimI-like enzyme
MSKQWKIRKTNKSDAQAIFSLILTGRIDTYVNDELGVTRDFILSNELYHPGYGFYKDECNFNYFMNTKDNLHLVAEDENGIIIGSIHCTRDGDGQQINSLYVFKEFHGTGLAQELATEFDKWEDKSQDSWLGVVAYNKRAINFYEKLGFKYNGVKYDIYDKIPCIDMVKLNREDK